MEVILAELKSAENLRGKGEDKLWVVVISVPNTAVARSARPKVAPHSSLQSKPHSVP